MLNQTGGAWRSSSVYGQGDSSTSIVLDDVMCNGAEASLNDCTFRQIGNDCSHSEDVGVACGGG